MRNSLCLLILELVLILDGEKAEVSLVSSKAKGWRRSSRMSATIEDQDKPRTSSSSDRPAVLKVNTTTSAGPVTLHDSMATALNDSDLEDMDDVIITPGADGDLSNSTVKKTYVGSSSNPSSTNAQEAPASVPSLGPFNLPAAPSAPSNFTRLEIDEHGSYQVDQSKDGSWFSGSWSRYMNDVLGLMCLSSKH